MSFCRQMKCSPAKTVFSDMGSRGRACSLGLMRKVEMVAPTAVISAMAYTADGPRNRA